MFTNKRFVYKQKICLKICLQTKKCLQTKGLFANQRYVYKPKVCLQTKGLVTNQRFVYKLVTRPIEL